MVEHFVLFFIGRFVDFKIYTKYFELNKNLIDDKKQKKKKEKRTKTVKRLKEKQGLEYLKRKDILKKGVFNLKSRTLNKIKMYQIKTITLIF